MGELHLDILVDRMRREFNVEANIGKPQVAYRETIRRTVEKAEYVHKKQTGGSGQYAKVLVNLAPLPLDGEATYEFENAVTGGRIPAGQSQHLQMASGHASKRSTVSVQRAGWHPH